MLSNVSELEKRCGNDTRSVTTCYRVAKLDENLNGSIVINASKYCNGQIDSVLTITNNYHHLKCRVNV